MNNIRAVTLNVVETLEKMAADNINLTFATSLQFRRRFEKEHRTKKYFRHFSIAEKSVNSENGITSVETQWRIEISCSSKSIIR